MKKFTTFIFLSAIILVFSNQIFSQNKPTKSEQEKQAEFRRWDEEATYIAPIRYVIVYNEVFDSKVRWLDIVIDEKQFNEENLRKTFELIKKRFPEPFAMNIEIHTNLETIETPEEKEMSSDNRGRLTAKKFLHKMAGISRFNGGREALIYTISLKPYEEKLVVITNKP